MWTLSTFFVFYWSLCSQFGFWHDFVQEMIFVIFRNIKKYKYFSGYYIFLTTEQAATLNNENIIYLCNNNIIEYWTLYWKFLRYNPNFPPRNNNIEHSKISPANNNNMIWKLPTQKFHEHDWSISNGSITKIL